MSRDKSKEEKIKEKILEEKLSLLRLELTNLTSKINSTVDSLWKIRAAAFLIWAASVGYSLDPIKNNAQPLTTLLLVTILIPLCFSIMDAKYNQWYRRFSAREEHIQKFISSGSLDKMLLEEDYSFSVYDISGEATLSEDPTFVWRTSLLRSWIDTTSLAIYGSQTLISALLSTLYGSFGSLGPEWRIVLIPSVIILFLTAYIIGWIKRRKLLP